MTNNRSVVAKLTVAALLASPAGPLFGWQSPPTRTAAAAPVTPASKAAPLAAYQTAAPVANPTAKPSHALQAPDGGWPRHYTTQSGAVVVLYQPQVGPWPDQQHMTMFAAVSYHAANADKPALGTLKIESNTKVALDQRLVSFSDFNITMANFPTVSKDDVKVVVAEVQNAIPHQDRVIALDRVLAMVETSAVRPKNIEGVKADPPPIFYSDKPAVMVNFDGDPIWSPIPGNELKFAVNTNWDLFEYAAGNSYFLRVNDSWMTAASIKGPWKQAAKLPESFSKLPADANWSEVKAAVPGKLLVASAVPAVFVSTVPAELILANGAPQYTPVPGTSLLWMNNTEDDVFRMGKDGLVYFLVAGRWFSSPQFTGPWTFATPSLPADFKKIPLEHPRSRVLASVPGTRQAIEAVLLAQIPQTARVNRKEVKAPDVAYSGEPKFEPIEQTTVARAVNTDMDVIKVGDLYFLCFQGVWFKSTTPDGPWVVTDSVPKAIYEIPISSPASNVTYVTVEDSDDEWVEFAAAAAYSGMWIGWGCAMWGSGWDHPPYYYGGGYYGHYPTYGYGARYNPWTGAYTRGAGVYGPYGGAGYASRYNARTGTYSRGAMAYGPAGARGAASAWNPRTGTSAQTRQGSNVYGSWGGTSVQRGDSWANTARVTNRATGTTTRATQGSGGGGAVTRNTPGPGGGGVGRTGSGDVYAGKDGNVYRNQGGSWQKYDGGNWNSVNRSGASATTLTNDNLNQLNRDWASRGDGAQRTRDAGSVRSGGGYSGSYHPSGGGTRSYGGGGGGMRMGGGGMRGGGGGGRR